MTLKLLDTFAGIGGFSYAAERLVGGFKTTQFIEIEPYCQKILNKHWPEVPIHDDITTFTAEPFQYDVICGGFPCQSISTAGKGEGITETSKSGLWFELIRTIRMVRPKYFVLENVSAILNNGLDIVLRDIYETGNYECQWCCIPSSSIGACHQRDRWFLLGISTDTKGSKGNEYETERGDGKTRIQKVSRNRDRSENPYAWRFTEHRLNPNWRGYVSKQCLCRGDDGLRNRVDRLKALGNSVVPQVVAIPLQKVIDLEKNYQLKK